MTERSVFARARGIAAPAPGEAEGADSAVIQASVAEPEHFAAIFRRHGLAIQRYATSRLGAGAADDLVAETFLAAFRQRAGYDVSHPDARPWLYGIATNLIGRQRRAEVRQYRALARAGAGMAAGPDASAEPFTERVDASVTASAAGPALAAALARLPGQYRHALLLIAWGGLTYEEAALALGVPVGTVRSRISRARTKLRRSLADAGITVSTEEETCDD